MPPGVAVKVLHVALVATALLGAPVFVVLTRGIFGASPPLRTQVWLQVAYCVLAVGLVWTAMRLQKLSLSSIGLRRPTLATVLLAATLAVVVLLVLPIVTAPLVKWAGPDRLNAGVRELSVLPVWFRIWLAVAGGVIEETLYRGYAFGRLEGLTRSRWFAGAIVVVVFTLAHISPWGTVYSLIAVLPFSVLMTAAYAWRRDLLANSAAHSAALLVGLLTI